MNIRKNIISIILILIGILLPLKTKFDNYIYKVNEKTQIKNYKEKKESDYLLILEIPKISLVKGIYPIYSNKNNINKEVFILHNSNINTNNIYLASHSGTSSNSYFNEIILLKQKDLIYIYLNGKKYTYIVSNIKYIEKTGYLEISPNKENTLTLITCSTKYKDKQLITTAILNKIDP